VSTPHPDSAGAVFAAFAVSVGAYVVLSHDASPDGRTIALETGTLDCTVIAAVQIASERIRRLTSCRGPFRAAVGPSWQPQAVQEH
jgi:hypothetical protein